MIHPVPSLMGMLRSRANSKTLGLAIYPQGPPDWGNCQGGKLSLYGARDSHRERTEEKTLRTPSLGDNFFWKQEV